MQRKIPPPFVSRAEVDAYLSGDQIECLLCGGSFRVLTGKHLRRVHGISSAEYREMFAIPSGRGLCCQAYGATRSEILQKLRDRGGLDCDPAAASEAAKNAGRGVRVSWDIEEQARRAEKLERRQIEPGGNRADGRDADHARQYQRAYRAQINTADKTKKEPPAEAEGS